MKHSVQKRIIVIFAAEFFAILVVCALISFLGSYSSELKKSRDNARNATEVAGSILSESRLDTLTLPENRELYEKVRSRMRALCRGFALDYLYIYTVDENKARHYIMTVARHDDDDRVAAEKLSLGAVTKTELHEQELSAMQGKTSDKLFIIKNEFGHDITWIFPFFDAQGKTIALIGADDEFDIRNSGLLQRFLLMILPLSLILVLVHTVLFLMLKKHVVAPLKVISERMQHYDPSHEDEHLQISSQDEMQQIADAFWKMSCDIHLYIKNLASITAEREQAKAQLDIARKIQYGMVPAFFSDCRNGVDISALMQPAKEVGGDFYDAFALENGNYCALIGDVSGKGVAGALFMALTKSMLKGRMKQIMDPAAVLNKVNDELCSENPEGMFATVFIIVIDPKTGFVQYANAGHNAPILITGDNVSFINPEPGIALGLFEDAGIRTGKLTLKKGNGLLLYTDGVTEAVNSEKAFFGTEKLLSLLKESSPKESSTAANSVKNSVEEFFSGCDQFDDITVLSLFYRGEEGELELKPSLDEFKTIKKSVLELCAGSSSAKKALLACEEAFVNIVSYSGASYIKFSCSAGGGVLTVTLKDNGKSFDPFAGENTVEKDFESFDKGGMGINLIRQIAEKTEWEFENGNNVLTLTFKI